MPGAEARAAALIETPEPSGTAPVPPTARTLPPSVRPMVIAVVAVIVIGLVGLVTWPYWRVVEPGGTLEPRAAPATVGIESPAPPDAVAERPEPQSAVVGNDNLAESQPTGTIPADRPSEPQPAVVADKPSGSPPIGAATSDRSSELQPVVVADKPPDRTSIAVAELKAEGERLTREMGGLVTQLGEVGRGLRTLRGRVDQAGASATSETRAQLEKLGERLAALEAQEISPGDLRGEWLAAMEAEKATLMREMAGLAQRMATLETGVASQAGRMEVGSRLVLAVGQLRQAIDRGVAHAAEIESALALAVDNAEIRHHLEVLADGAETGVPTVAALRADFAWVVGRIVRAQASDGERGWMATVIDRLASVVTVRRVGDISGEETDAIVARAETRLLTDDLAGAVAEVETLSGPAAAAAADWLAEAKRRIGTERALDAAQAALLAPGASSDG